MRSSIITPLLLFGSLHSRAIARIQVYDKFCLRYLLFGCQNCQATQYTPPTQNSLPAGAKSFWNFCLSAHTCLLQCRLLTDGYRRAKSGNTDGWSTEDLPTATCFYDAVQLSF
ncbi:hypothetical protein BCR34DRAFT_630952 [Clohesyomyces aquaticus]|uniref:Secreted protein n=1 Tax=Clohesyomyces aquaticus TaxID=1231657 RepID=A0A1Y1ZBW6_9PLEO|nr:hypothetical protein BCR34DRAFT_630952 [Clohesyomyces aquaticus]